MTREYSCAQLYTKQKKREQRKEDFPLDLVYFTKGEVGYHADWLLNGCGIKKDCRGAFFHQSQQVGELE